MTEPKERWIELVEALEAALPWLTPEGQHEYARRMAAYNRSEGGTEETEALHNIDGKRIAAIDKVKRVLAAVRTTE